MRRVDVLTHVETIVFDISTQTGLYGSGVYLWQPHVSHDDNVFSFTVRDDGNFYGAGTYTVSTNTYKYFPWLGFDFDECQIDQSGEYLLIKERIASAVAPIGDRVIRLSDNREVRRETYDAGGHSDMGYRVAVMGNDNLAWPAVDLLDLAANPLVNGPVVYHDASYAYASIVHVSFLNAIDAALANQYAIGSAVHFVNGPRGNEIVAFKLDGSLKTLVISPCLTMTPASQPYELNAFANVDPTGRYVFWTSNLGVDGGPLVALVVQVPRGVPGWDA
jgi:hypothetical protein